MGQKKKRGKKNRKGNTQGNPDVDCVDQEVSGDRVLGAAKDVIKVDRTFAAAGEWGTLSPSLSPHSLHVLNHVLGFKTMTPVQKSVIPLLLTHRDVAAEACTGSGKTLSFVLPMLELLWARDPFLRPLQVGGLVVTPTRELALQIYHVVKIFAKPCSNSSDSAVPSQCENCVKNLGVLLLIGGNEKEKDIERMKVEGCNIIVGTPGRLVDFFSTVKGMDMKGFEIFIMDEADRLFDMGFQIQLGKILQILPKQRRTGLFSATQTQQLEHIIRSGMRNAVRVRISVESKSNKSSSSSEEAKHLKHQFPTHSLPASLSNHYITCSESQKLDQLLHLFSSHLDQKFIVYFMTCASVDFYYRALLSCGVLGNQLVSTTSRKKKKQQKNQEEANKKAEVFQIYSIHGRIPHNRRIEVYQKFCSLDANKPLSQEEEKEEEDDASEQGDGKNKKRGGALLTTDLAARGLDIPNVDIIVQFSPPQHSQTFIHRVGRTARAGGAGTAILFVTPEESDYLHFLEIQQIPLKEMTPQPIPKKKMLLGKVRDRVLKDRELFDKSTRAFVSHMRAYKEHQLNYIFRFAQLDFPDLAKAFCLVQAPKVKELKGRSVHWEGMVDKDIVDRIPYLDKAREKSRKEKEAKEKAAEEKKIEMAAEKLKERKDFKEDAGQKRKKEIGVGNEKKRRKVAIEDEWEELQKEARLLKKLKRGKISKKAFERMVDEGEDEDDEDDEEEDDDDDVEEDEEEEMVEEEGEGLLNQEGEGEEQEQEEQEEMIVEQTKEEEKLNQPIIISKNSKKRKRKKESKAKQERIKKK